MNVPVTITLIVCGTAVAAVGAFSPNLPVIGILCFLYYCLAVVMIVAGIVGGFMPPAKRSKRGFEPLFPKPSLEHEDTDKMPVLQEAR